MDNSVLDNISFVGHVYYYFDGWRNGRTGAISNVAGDFIYRFVEAKRNEKGNLVKVYEHNGDNPIVAVGIVAYWLSIRRNNNPFIHSLGGGAKRETKFFDEIFESYTKERYRQFKEKYKDSPDSWKWNWDYEFYGKMIVPNEIMLNKQTEALFEYITDEDIKLVRSVMDNYIEYLKKCRTDRNIHVGAELKVLRSIDLMDESKLEDMEDFEVNTILDKLESNGYVKVAWLEGHAPEAVKLLDAGRTRLKELEKKAQSEESELERLKKENESLRRQGILMHPARRVRIEFWAKRPEELERRRWEEEQEQKRREWEMEKAEREVRLLAEMLGTTREEVKDADLQVIDTAINDKAPKRNPSKQRKSREETVQSTRHSSHKKKKPKSTMPKNYKGKWFRLVTDNEKMREAKMKRLYKYLLDGLFINHMNVDDIYKLDKELKKDDIDKLSCEEKELMLFNAVVDGKDYDIRIVWTNTKKSLGYFINKVNNLGRIDFQHGGIWQIVQTRFLVRIKEKQMDECIGKKVEVIKVVELQANDFNSHNFGEENPKLDPIINEIFGVSIKEEIEDEFRGLVDKKQEEENDAGEMLSDGYRDTSHGPTWQ